MNFFCVVACSVMIAIAPLRTPQNTTRADVSALQGNWVLDGESKGMGDAPKHTLEVKGATMIFRFGDRVTRHFTATLDAAKQPRAMELIEVQSEEQPFLAIYKIENNKLTLCIGVEKVRPTGLCPTRFEASAVQVLTGYVKRSP